MQSMGTVSEERVQFLLAHPELCRCDRCVYDEDYIAEKSAKNDEIIRWPEETCTHDESTEFPLRLRGFNWGEQLEVMGALQTLGKYGITLADLNRGSADSPGLKKAVEEGLVVWIGSGVRGFEDYNF